MEQKARIKVSRQQRRQRWTWFLFIAPALVIYIWFMAFPLVNSMRLSLYTGEGLTPERFVGLANYRELFTDTLWHERWLNALKNTFIFFGIHMLIQNTLGLLFAALLSSPIKGRNIYRTIIFIPVTLSTLVVGFLWSLLLNPRWGIINQTLVAVGLESWALPWLGDPNFALIVISLASVWQWVGMPTMLFMAGLLSIPDDIIEAALVDGASPWKSFWRVKFPLLMPTIGIVSVLTFVGNFNAFDIVFAMASSRGEPNYASDILGTFFYRTAIAGEHPVAEPNMGVGAAVATLTFSILLVGVSIWLFYSRQHEHEM